MPYSEDDPLRNIAEDLPVTGRFAPSPTGPLHFGSLVAAAGSWLFARSAGGKWLVRMEDLDTPRVVPGSADEILRTLEAFGLIWDEEPVFQSRRTALYQEALRQLRDAGLVYDCCCSRAELRRSASAPSPSPADLDLSVYPGTCRKGTASGRKPRSLRFKVSDETIRFTDIVHGAIEEDLVNQCGDFVVKRADGPFAYQLAVVVDDADQGVTQVVRGGDLLSSAARQIALQRALGVPTPIYAHLPLIVGPDGAKLGKRTGAITVLDDDRSGMPSILRKVLETLGCGQLETDTPEAMLAHALTSFDPNRIPRGMVALGGRSSQESGVRSQ